MILSEMVLTNADCAFRTTQVNATILLRNMAHVLVTKNLRGMPWIIIKKNIFNGCILRICKIIIQQNEYFDQLNVALRSSHSILNYPIFFALLANKKTSRDLLILDEAHLLETEIVKFRGLSISEKMEKYSYFRDGRLWI
jgi:hypothetical protein